MIWCYTVQKIYQDYGKSSWRRFHSKPFGIGKQCPYWLLWATAWLFPWYIVCNPPHHFISWPYCVYILVDISFLCIFMLFCFHYITFSSVLHVKLGTHYMMYWIVYHYEVDRNDKSSTLCCVYALYTRSRGQERYALIGHACFSISQYRYLYGTRTLLLTTGTLHSVGSLLAMSPNPWWPR